MCFLSSFACPQINEGLNFQTLFHPSYILYSKNFLQLTQLLMVDVQIVNVLIYGEYRLTEESKMTSYNTSI